MYCMKSLETWSATFFSWIVKSMQQTESGIQFSFGQSIGRVYTNCESVEMHACSELHLSICYWNLPQAKDSADHMM